MNVSMDGEGEQRKEDGDGHDAPVPCSGRQGSMAAATSITACHGLWHAYASTIKIL